MKRLLGYSLVILFVQLFLNSCHTAIDNAITLYDSDIEDLSIDQLEKIVSLKPIKSKDLMKGVEFGLCFDEYFFLTSEDNTTLYCIVGDSVVATLNQQGRGYGEYLTINDYMFSKEDSVLYIMSQNQILKYKYPNKHRIADELLTRKLLGKGAVLVQGPKWCGKTTTAKQVAVSLLDLGDSTQLANALETLQILPMKLLEGNVPRLIDEWQPLLGGGVPGCHVIGVAKYILWCCDRRTDTFRWDRFLKRI